MNDHHNKIRIHSLDYLRGFLACVVMFYHYSLWSFGDFESDTVLGRVGIYGVSIFYILSGLTLFLVYRHSLSPSFDSLRSFALKRVFRIYPLLWVVTILWILASSMHYSPWIVFLNLSGLFGFIQPIAYIGTGVWSIGNELVFYAFFPILLFLERYRPAIFYFAFALIVLIALYYSFHVLNSDSTLESQWASYVNPFNQFFLFAGGVMIGHLFANSSQNIKPGWSYLMMAFLILIFCVYPVRGNLIEIVTGFNRIFFSLLGLIFCALVFLNKAPYPKYLNKPLVFIGQCSYSIYLLHPVVYKATELVDENLFSIPLAYLFPLNVALTFIASHISYTYLEIPLIQLGRTLNNKISSQNV